VAVNAPQLSPETAQRSLGDLGFFPQQWSAVSAPAGPVLVLAGPGAGKTRCLTGRIRYLVDTLRAAPERICAVTFTNKAAEEIVARLRRDMGPTAEHLWLGTIHRLCLDLLRPFARAVDLPPGFGVADEAHQQTILRRLRVSRYRKGQLLILFGRHRLTGYPLTPGDQTLFHAYMAELRRHRLVDYDDIIALTRLLFENDAGALASYQGLWDHLLVDEFQDLDPCQYEILQLLAGQHRSVFAVGDDEQSIFAWRGADPGLARRFQRDFEVAAPIVLDINCRCSIPIFETARRILPRDGTLFAKTIRATRPGLEEVRSEGFENEAKEAEWVAEDLIADLSRSQLPPGEYAVLFRTHEMGERMEQALIARGIPCRMGRNRALVDDPVIRQLVTSLRIALSPDSDLDVEQLARSVLPEPILLRLENQAGGSLLDRLIAYARASPGSDAKVCWRLIYQVENLRRLRGVHRSLPDLVDGILALGVGHYANPLERQIDLLTDPRANASAVELAEALGKTLASGGRILLAPAGGLEVPIRLLLRRVLPMATIEYLRGNPPSMEDLVVALSDLTAAVTTPAVSLAIDRGLRSTTVFKALQILESREEKRLLDEYVVFDTETTDKDIEACEVVELAAVRVRGGEVVDRFQTLVRCARPISPGAAAVHGYADSDLVGQPNLEAVWPRFRSFVGESVLVAHNGHLFDVPVLNRLTQAWGGLEGVTLFDSLPLARQVFGTGGLRLEDLATRFGIPTGRSHHALDDCLCLAAVIERLLEEHLRRSRMTCHTTLLDHVALGSALEDPSVRSDEDRALVESGTWRLFGRHSGLLEGYAAEAAATGISCPPGEQVVDRLGGRDQLDRVRRQTSPQDRYADAYARFRQVMIACDGVDLEESVRRFLDTVALSRSDGVGPDSERVSLLTFHATKGLEFSRVYILGVEDFQLPGYYAIMEDRDEEIREARRLLYVGMTRAKDRLILTRCSSRGGRPSGGTRFLQDMGLA
jgi:ATP-dependent DNA helicase UvrD/PcrA